MNMNFGGGGKYQKQPKEVEEGPKSRKEVFEEIIAKSKAYKMAKYEIKEAAAELTTRLDDQYFDILSLLNMSKVKTNAKEDVVLDSYE